MNYKLIFNIDNSTVKLDLLNQYSDAIMYLFDEFSRLLIFIIKMSMHTLLWISRPLYIFLFVIGAIIYLTRIHRWLGKDLIFSSIFLAILTEFILPLLINYIELSYP